MPNSPRLNMGLLLTGVLFLAVPATTWVQGDSLAAAMPRSVTAQAMQQRNQSAFAVILGEFRTNLSDLIFIKTERYLDSGIAYAPHIDAGELERSGKAVHSKHDEHEEDGHAHKHEAHEHGQKSHAGHAKHDHDSTHKHHEHTTHEEDDASTAITTDDHQTSLDQRLATPQMSETAHIKPGSAVSEPGHEYVPTIIMTADKDFRGFLGNLERNVKPWRHPSEGHKHTAGTELLPWYRLATYSNPNNVRMYMIGAWWLKTLKQRPQVEEALKFLEEGISHNPNSFQLYLMRGYILRQLERHQDALKSFHTAVETGLKTRPANPGSAPMTWNDDLEEELQSAMVMEILSIRDFQSTSSALQVARDYSAKFSPPNSVNRLKHELEQQLPGN
ncbi:MAG: tetratricopeptide repeat protein [Candidatus Sumerlaeaceae bacterium]